MGAVSDVEGRKALDLFHLQDVLVDALHLELRRSGGDTVAVQQKPMEVLLYLAENHPRLVQREELIDKVWAGNFYVGEKALTNAVWQLRTSFEGLGVSGLVETVRKRGYRLGIEPVAAGGADGAAQQGASSPAADPRAPLRLRGLLAAVAAVLLTAFTGGYFLAMGGGNRAPESGAVSVDPLGLGSGLGRARFPALSPDGSRLAYVWRPYGGSENIYYQRLDAPGDAQQLTFSAHRKGRIAWDHRGRYIVFPRHEGSGRCDLVALDVTTRTEQVLTDCRRSGTAYLAAHPQRSEFYFTGQPQDGSNLYVLRWDGGDADVSLVPCSRHCDYPARDLSFSPDGRYLALTRRVHSFSEDLYVRDLLVGEERRLTSDVHDILGLDWHPDGRHIIMAAVQGGARQGYLVDAQSGRQVPLDVEDFSHPSRATADGTVYFTSEDAQFQLSYLRVPHEAPSALFPLTLSDFHYRDPHVSPVTGEFAFVSNRSGPIEIWIADAGLADARQVTGIGGMVRYPRWSHDGGRIAFVARFPHEKHDVLAVLEVATGRVRSLHRFERLAGRPTWWHDDSAIIVRERGNLQRLDLATGDMEPLTGDGGIYAQSVADGSVYFTRGTNLGLWKRLPDGSIQQVLDEQSFGARYSWVATDAGIYYYDQRTRPEMLSFHDFGTGSSTGVLAVPPELVTVQSTFAYDPIGSRLIIDSLRPRSTLASFKHPLLRAAD